MEDDGKDVEHDETDNPPPPAPAPEPEKPVDDVKAIIEDLKSRIDGMEETLQTVIAQNGERDSVPTKKPWTHWGNSR